MSRHLCWLAVLAVLVFSVGTAHAKITDQALRAAFEADGYRVLRYGIAWGSCISPKSSASLSCVVCLTCHGFGQRQHGELPRAARRGCRVYHCNHPEQQAAEEGVLCRGATFSCFFLASIVRFLTTRFRFGFAGHWLSNGVPVRLSESQRHTPHGHRLRRSIHPCAHRQCP